MRVDLLRTFVVLGATAAILTETISAFHQINRGVLAFAWTVLAAFGVIRLRARLRPISAARFSPIELTIVLVISAILGVSGIAGELGASRRGQLMAALFCATLPGAILQAFGPKNDLLFGLWLVCAMYFGSRGNIVLWSFVWISARHEGNGIHFRACVVRCFAGAHVEPGQIRPVDSRTNSLVGRAPSRMFCDTLPSS